MKMIDRMLGFRYIVIESYCSTCCDQLTSRYNGDGYELYCVECDNSIPVDEENHEFEWSKRELFDYILKEPELSLRKIEVLCTYFDHNGCDLNNLLNTIVRNENTIFELIGAL
jgi:hypothetical protein